jgi:hypothetical protein
VSTSPATPRALTRGNILAARISCPGGWQVRDGLEQQRTEAVHVRLLGHDAGAEEEWLGATRSSHGKRSPGRRAARRGRGRRGARCTPTRRRAPRGSPGRLRRRRVGAPAQATSWMMCMRWGHDRAAAAWSWSASVPQARYSRTSAPPSSARTQ